MALPLKTTYAVLALFGSITARAMYLAGMRAAGAAGVTLVIGLVPVMVAKTFPVLSATIRTLSLVPEIPIALTGTPALKT